eukprot:CAMPEP_0119570526 /NCGR_PEP_ID=MMETSP1352-20130426/43655_1 /TAXON_ID=265584 /ORGANISM="Stauroneis constricta, Strain CCMP1120" /LENGTH=428 /DNA_ID=CAMNT_0007620195 /DNA_START=141 /DNA_END=1428 /DNA_ORIENTATION=+
MADPAIPIASVVDVLPAPTAPSSGTSGLLARGRSKRVVMKSAKETTTHTLTQQEKASLKDQGFTDGLIDALEQNSVAFPLALTQQEKASLKDQGFTDGLIDALEQNSVAFPLRIWVVDNSGSMARNDGNRMIATKKRDVKMVSCTRWVEIRETVDYHSQMARLLQVPTVFRLLNDPGKAAGEQQFSIGERGQALLDDDLRIARQTMQKAQPSGVTPLASHVREIRQNVLSMLPQLDEHGGKVVIVLATDGLPTDEMGYSNGSSKQDFQNSLRSLEGLPVWIVVRLCTDEEDIVEYYNDLDSQLELSLEVLDDFGGEAEEIHEHNKWLNYALPLHRMREMGFYHRLFDLLDERKFTLDELRDFMFLLFGAGKMDGVEDPQANFKSFLESVKMMVKNESHQWNPITKRMGPWIDVKELKKAYGKSTCTIM